MFVFLGNMYSVSIHGPWPLTTTNTMEPKVRDHNRIPRVGSGLQSLIRDTYRVDCLLGTRTRCCQHFLDADCTLHWKTPSLDCLLWSYFWQAQYGASTQTLTTAYSGREFWHHSVCLTRGEETCPPLTKIFRSWSK